MDPAAIAQMTQMGLDLFVLFPFESHSLLITEQDRLAYKVLHTGCRQQIAMLDPHLQHYYHAATAILAYDYFLTLEDEVGIVVRQPRVRKA